MPTKAFITHFREKIFYIGVQNVHIPKIYFARVFHQAYIYLLFLRKGMPCQLFLLYKSLTTITSNEWLCGGGVTKIASFNVYMYTNYYSLFINKESNAPLNATEVNASKFAPYTTLHKSIYILHFVLFILFFPNECPYLCLLRVGYSLEQILT